MNDTESLRRESSEGPVAGRDLASRIAGIAGYVANLPRGERAILRRLGRSQDSVPPEVFWRLADKFGIGRREEDYWLSVVPLMVKYPHRPGLAPGAALASAGVKGTRLERWLRTDHDAALRSADRLLARVDGGFDWVALGFLLRTWKESLRRRLARDFYLSPEQRERRSAEEGDN